MKDIVIKELQHYIKEFDGSDSFTEQAKLLMLIKNSAKTLIRVLKQEEKK